MDESDTSGDESISSDQSSRVGGGGGLRQLQLTSGIDLLWPILEQQLKDKFNNFKGVPTSTIPSFYLDINISPIVSLEKQIWS